MLHKPAASLSCTQHMLMLLFASWVLDPANWKGYKYAEFGNKKPESGSISSLCSTFKVSKITYNRYKRANKVGASTSLAFIKHMKWSNILHHRASFMLQLSLFTCKLIEQVVCFSYLRFTFLCNIHWWLLFLGEKQEP